MALPNRSPLLPAVDSSCWHCLFLLPRKLGNGLVWGIVHILSLLPPAPIAYSLLAIVQVFDKLGASTTDR